MDSLCESLFQCGGGMLRRIDKEELIGHAFSVTTFLHSKDRLFLLRDPLKLKQKVYTPEELLDLLRTWENQHLVNLYLLKPFSQPLS